MMELGHRTFCHRNMMVYKDWSIISLKAFQFTINFEKEYVQVSHPRLTQHTNGTAIFISIPKIINSHRAGLTAFHFHLRLFFQRLGSAAQFSLKALI